MRWMTRGVRGCAEEENPYFFFHSTGNLLHSTPIPTDIGEHLLLTTRWTRGARGCAEEDNKVDDEGAVCRGGERRKADRRAVGVRSSSSSWSPTVRPTKVSSIELGSPGVPALPKILFTTHAGYYRKYYRLKSVKSVAQIV